MKIKIFFLLFIITVFPAFSQYHNNEKQLNELKNLYITNGYVFPTSCYPVSRRQLLSFAHDLKKKVVKKDELLKIDRVITELKEVDKVGFIFNLSGVGNYRTDRLWNDDIYRNFYELPPLFDIYVLLYNNDTAVEVHNIWRREYRVLPGNNFPEGEEGNFSALENQFLNIGLLSLHIQDIEMMVGRTPVHFGNPDFNTLLPSNRLPFFDLVQVNVPIGPIRLISQIATLENREAISDIYDETAGEFAFGVNTIMTALHRFEYNTSWISGGITGYSILSRQKNGYMLGDFFPVFSWHTADVGWHNNAMFGDLTITPFEGWNYFYQTGFDDINASEILGMDDSSIPTIQSSIMGVSYRKKIDNSVLLTKIEMGKTHYLWGNFYGGSAVGDSKDHYFEKAVYRIFLDDGNRIMPLTSPYGPGAEWYDFSVSLFDLSKFSLILEYLLLIKNTEADLITTPYDADDDVKEGNVDLINNITFRTEYKSSDSFKLYVEPGLVVFNTELAFEFIFGGTFSFSRFADLKDFE